MLTLEKFYMGRDKKFAAELTDEIKTNADILIAKVNALLKDLGWEKAVEVSSGWRPAGINSKTPNAAKRSSHMIGMAVDLVDDKDQTLGKKILSRPDLLKKHGLWLEALAATKGQYTNWAHLDFKARSPRDVQVFTP